MKKIFGIFIIIIFSLFTKNVKAQGLAGGLEGAVTTSSVRISDLDNRFTDVIKGKGIMGFEAGIFIRGNLLGPIYLKPKLLLDYQGGTLSYTVSDQTQNVSFHAGKILFPVLVGLKFLPPLSVE